MTEQEIKQKQGKRLKQCLEYKKMTQLTLSKLAHVSQPWISGIVQGKNKLSSENAVLFSRVLGVRLEFLLLEDDWMTDSERIERIAKSRTQQQYSCFSLIEALGYTIIDSEQKPDGSSGSIHRSFKRITVNEGDTPEQILENAEYAIPVRVFKIKAPDGRISDIEQEELLKMIKDIEDFAKFKCEQPFNRFKHIHIKPRRE